MKLIRSRKRQLISLLTAEKANDQKERKSMAFSTFFCGVSKSNTKTTTKEEKEQKKKLKKKGKEEGNRQPVCSERMHVALFSCCSYLFYFDFQFKEESIFEMGNQREGKTEKAKKEEIRAKYRVSS